jgi:cell fate (sporulation/competence/biofilm development) regulator YmcA (YheA/YmcA/DUF963 family)
MGRNIPDFNNGFRPNLVDIHSAVLGGHLSKEEGMGLSPIYQPDKVMRKGTDKKTGKPQTRTQAQSIENTIKHHPKYKKKSEDDNG